jgi:hypothetical protein
VDRAAPARAVASDSSERPGARGLSSMVICRSSCRLPQGRWDLGSTIARPRRGRRPSRPSPRHRQRDQHAHGRAAARQRATLRLAARRTTACGTGTWTPAGHYSPRLHEPGSTKAILTTRGAARAVDGRRPTCGATPASAQSRPECRAGCRGRWTACGLIVYGDGRPLRVVGCL